MSEKRERGKNFTEEDRCELTQIIAKYVYV